MPYYDVHCEKCDTTYEWRAPQFDSITPACTQCGEALTRLPSRASGFVFNGGGTYDKGYVSKESPK